MDEITPRFGRLREKIDAEGVAIGFGINQLRGAAPAILAARLGYDWLFIDMEHGIISQEDASQIAVAALSNDVTPLVRCCKTALDEGVRLLDNGAAGLVIPHVNTVEEAREAIAAVRYPPVGHRSLSSLLPQIGYQRGDWRQLAPALNGSFLLFLMIESAEGCRNAAAIAALDGFDGLFLGASDLAADMGFPGEPDHPDVVAACCDVAEVCQRAGRWLVLAGTRTGATVARLHAAGACMFLGGADFAFVEAGARAALGHMHGALSAR
jgi:2-keto-3-deoxy-L-rhamnonate aldolase RhmA